MVGVVGVAELFSLCHVAVVGSQVTEHRKQEVESSEGRGLVVIRIRDSDSALESGKSSSVDGEHRQSSDKGIVCLVIYIYVRRRIVGRGSVLDILVRGGGVDEVLSVIFVARAHVVLEDAGGDARKEDALDDMLVGRRPVR